MLIEHPKGRKCSRYRGRLSGFSEFYQERDGIGSDHPEAVAQQALKEVLWNRSKLYVDFMLRLWVEMPELGKIPADQQYFINIDRANGGIAKQI